MKFKALSLSPHEVNLLISKSIALRSVGKPALICQRAYPEISNLPDRIHLDTIVQDKMVFVARLDSGNWAVCIRTQKYGIQKILERDGLYYSIEDLLTMHDLSVEDIQEIIQKLDNFESARGR
jgi:hypothetical protein